MLPTSKKSRLKYAAWFVCGTFDFFIWRGLFFLVLLTSFYAERLGNTSLQLRSIKIKRWSVGVLDPVVMVISAGPSFETWMMSVEGIRKELGVWKKRTNKNGTWYPPCLYLIIALDFVNVYYMSWVATQFGLYQLPRNNAICHGYWTVDEIP